MVGREAGVSDFFFYYESKFKIIKKIFIFLGGGLG